MKERTELEVVSDNFALTVFRIKFENSNPEALDQKNRELYKIIKQDGTIFTSGLEL